MSPLEFSEINDIYRNFILNIADKRMHIIIPIMRYTFQQYYSPNLFSLQIPGGLIDEEDQKIYIKDSIFVIDSDDNSYGNMLEVRRYIFDRRGNHQYVETISFRELLFVYCNPEGKLLLEKACFEINEVNWEQIKKDESMSHMSVDYPYDDIPF